MRIRAALASLCLSLTACAPVIPGSDQPEDLAGFFDCVREQNGALISAHRGGPSPGYAENALETFKHNADQGLLLLEIDVRTARDGTLFLLHDDTLDRTSLARGIAEDLSWEALQNIELVDENKKPTGAYIPRFDDVLRWAGTAPVVLQLDIKGRTRLEDAISALHAAKMAQRVMLITYTETQAINAAHLAPDTPLSVSIKTIEDYQNLITKGVDPRQIIAWTGIRAIKPKLYRALAQNGVESIYGALGTLDKLAEADGTPAPYRNLIADGVHIIATNRAGYVRTAITADDRAEARCTLPN